MSNVIQLGWGRQSVVKSYPLAALTVVVFAIINCNALDLADTDAVVKDVVKRAYGTSGANGPDTVSTKPITRHRFLPQ